MNKRSTWRNLAAIAVLATAVSAAHAADVNGRIRGSVTDSAGAVIPNVQVTAVNEQTGVKFTTTSLANGDYRFQQLPIGTYTISASSNGFKSFSASGIVLNIDQEYTEKVVLSVGQATETISVAADAVQVNTTDMQLNNIVTGPELTELPLVSRSFTALELILPGVQAPDTRFGASYSVSGSQAQQSSFLINGADTNDITLNTLTVSPSPDAIGQFNLIDGPLNAEYDRNSGAIVSSTIVQGTNHFHGDVFEFYRDTFLNTNNYFQKRYSTAGVRTDVVAPYHQHIFGGTIGGPVFRDKLFFFGSYQGTRQRTPEGTYANIIPTTANLNGDFSADVAAKAFSNNPIPSTINIPGCATPGQTWASCLNAKGGILLPSTFNAITAALAKQYVPQTTTGSFSYNATTKFTDDQYIGRVDFSPNAKNQITVVGIYDTGKTSNDIPFSGSTLPGFGDGAISHIQQYTFDYVRQISNTAVNDLAAHYTRFNFNSGAPQTVFQPSAAGFSITPQDAASSTLPSLSVAGGFSIGGTTNGPQPRIDQAIQFDDDFTKTIGHHTIKIGYDGRRFNVSNTFDASNSGAYSFSQSGIYSTGDANLDFLLGVPATYSQGTGSVIQADAFLNYVFAQDSWKVTPAFTLSYGLGYSIDTPLRNHQFGGEAVSCFSIGQQSQVFPGAPVGLNFPGDPGCFNSGQAYTRHNELGPRFGFAWAPDLGKFFGPQGTFAIRGGIGIYYNRTEEESALQTLGTPPFGFTSNGAGDFGGNASLANPFVDINGGGSTGATGGKGTALEANRFPYTEPVKGQNVDFSGFLPIYNISSFDKSFRSPYAENFQLSIERELPSRMILRTSYVASLGRRNQVTYEGNPVTAAGQAACAASTTCIARRTLQAFYYPSHTIANNPSFISTGEVGSYASSSYNSLQVGLQKAATHGFQFQLSYTYSHALDTASSFENSGFGSSGQRGYNQFNPQLNYGDSTFDVRQRLVFSPLYIAPVLKGYSAYNPINLALSGWEVSAIISVATGQPFDISYAGNSSNSLYCSIQIGFYACPDVPQQTAPISYGGIRTRLANGNVQYFNRASFAAEPIGKFGNVHRNPYHGPGINNTNMVIAKNFNLSADGVRRLQLRLTSNNVFNHTQFSNPATTFLDSVPTSTTTTFGQISSAAAARLTQLSAKIYF